MSKGSSKNRQVPILYEDDSYIVFDKPACLLVIPTPKNEKNTLVNIVNQQCADIGSWNLHPCHRLDREVSGAIIFAKGKRSQKLMMELFKQRQVAKKYIAFVHGKMSTGSGEFRSSIEKSKHLYLSEPGLRNPDALSGLGISGRNQKNFKKNLSVQSAITRYKVIEERKGFSIVEVYPVTGRNNQIRIHFSKNRHPLLGDRKYSFQRDYDLKFRRTALHAMALEWQNPVTHEKVDVRSNLPNDMEVFLGNDRCR